MDNITFQYPSWYFIFCVLAGLVYALTLYFRDRTFKENANWLNWLLGAARFLAVTSIATLLLSPLLKSVISETKKPVVILAQDVSESVGVTMDSVQRQVYSTEFNKMRDDLSQKYEVKNYSFGSDVREGVDFEFNDKVSNVSEMLSSLYDLYSNQNLGAVVLATDGIYNEGSNPIYASTKLTTPIYTVALGDTTSQKDIVLKRVFHNKIAYLGDKFSIQTDISAINCTAQATSLTVSKIIGGKSQRIQQIPITINKNDFFTTKEIVIDADNAGVQRYRISVNSVQGEITTKNNSKDIFVDVLDARQKILLLANSPHPDVSAIKQSIQSNKNYQVTTDYITGFKGNLASYDFVILHQLPSTKYDISSIINQLNERKTPRLFIVGTQTALPTLNKYQNLLNISGNNRQSNEVQATIDPAFSLFTLDDNVRNNLRNFAPLTVPFGEFKMGGEGSVLLKQRIGKVDTDYPLLIIGDDRGTKTGVLSGEGLWKWRLFDYLQYQNHDITEEVIAKTVQYLTLKEDKRKFRVNLAKNIFNENEAIYFDAELYNSNYELINEPDASLTIKDGEGRDYNFTFNKSGSSYKLNVGILPVGNYNFTGKTFNNGESLTYNGQFSVQPVQLEAFQTRADHGALRILSEEYGGALYYPNQLAELGAALTAKDFKPILYQTNKTRSVINLKWIFFALLALLTFEWFMRRYHGGY
jgi:hypothetical protein